MMNGVSSLAEADSTTGLTCNSPPSGCLSSTQPLPEPEEGFFKQVLKPLLVPGHEDELLEWMKDFNLLCNNVKCIKQGPDCAMMWSPTRVVDKFQWQCSSCHNKVHIRQNSFFKNVFCPLPIAIKVILAWCQDLDFSEVAIALGIKKQIVGSVYDKLEKLIYTSPNLRLGGPNGVTLIELFPDMIGEMYPDSSKNDSTSKSQIKILCIADTKHVPTRYWLHVITGSVFLPTENNNTKFKKVNMVDEINHILQKTIIPGGYGVIGGGSYFSPLFESLKSKNLFQNIVKTNELTSECGKDLQEFFTHKIWKSALKLCEAAQDLPKNKMQAYLSCCLWRRENEKLDAFQSMIQLIADQDYSDIVQKKK